MSSSFFLLEKKSQKAFKNQGLQSHGPWDISCFQVFKLAEKHSQAKSSGTGSYFIGLKGWRLNGFPEFIGFCGTRVAMFLEKGEECLFFASIQGTVVGKCLEKVNEYL